MSIGLGRQFIFSCGTCSSNASNSNFCGCLITLEQQVCNLLSDVQMNLSDKPDGTISCINVEIQTVKFIHDYLHFDFKSPGCELCPHDHSYVILAGLMNDSSVSDVLPYITC